MDNPSDLLFAIVGIAIITAFIIAVLLQSITRHRAPGVIYVTSPYQSEDSGSGCGVIVLLGLLLSILILSSS